MAKDPKYPEVRIEQTLLLLILLINSSQTKVSGISQSNPQGSRAPYRPFSLFLAYSFKLGTQVADVHRNTKTNSHS